MANQRAVQFAKNQIEHVSLAGERVRNLQLNSTGIVIESFKLVLLPVWIGSYQYQGQLYRVALDGQTTKMTGQIPRNGHLSSWCKECAIRHSHKGRGASRRSLLLQRRRRLCHRPVLPEERYFPPPPIAPLRLVEGRCAYVFPRGKVR